MSWLSIRGCKKNAFPNFGGALRLHPWAIAVFLQTGRLGNGYSRLPGGYPGTHQRKYDPLPLP